MVTVTTSESIITYVSAEDPKLAEFLQLMQPRRAGTIWSNEDATLAATSARKLPPPPALAAPAAAASGTATGGGKSSKHQNAAPVTRSMEAGVRDKDAADQDEGGCYVYHSAKLRSVASWHEDDANICTIMFHSRLLVWTP